MTKGILMNDYLMTKIALIKKCLEKYSNINMEITKDFDSTTGIFIDSEGNRYKVSMETEILLKSFFRKNKNTNNLINKDARHVLRNIDLIEKINYELTGNGNQVVVEDIEFNYSNELIIENVNHNIVLDGADYKSSSELYFKICSELGIESYSNLSNINPPNKTIVILKNYGLMLKNMTDIDKRSWVCDLRNCMENNEPLLFVLLNSDKDDDTFLRNNELVCRLIPFKN
jgi:hypothetical protein